MKIRADEQCGNVHASLEVECDSPEAAKGLIAVFFERERKPEPPPPPPPAEEPLEVPDLEDMWPNRVQERP